MRKNVPCQELVAFAAKVVLCALAIFIASFSFHTSTAQSQLIKDVNRSENPFIVEYSELTDDGIGNLYFISRSKELWKVNTNVLPKKAVRLRTMRKISQLTVGRRSVFFVGEDAGGTELWKSGGTVATTQKVKEIGVGSKGSNPANLTFINGRLYFAANNGRNGTELWKSDGTSAGTVMVKDIYPGSQGSDPAWIAELNGYVYFSAKNEANGFELWRTNGIESGTWLVKDIHAGAASSAPSGLTKANGMLFFAATNEANGREIWISNGTASGTKLLKDINAGSSSSDVNNFITMGSYCYFSANDGLNGYEVWKTNGQLSGTAMVTSHHEDSPYGKPFYFQVVADALYYVKYEGQEYTMHRSDGTASGTRSVFVLSRLTPPNYTVKGDKIYFFNKIFDEEDYRLENQLVAMDLDGANARMIRNFPIEEDWDGIFTDRFIPEMVSINNALYFFGILNEGEGVKLIESGGTYESHYVLHDTYIQTRSSNPADFVTFNGVTYFTATPTHPYFNTEVWRTDGTLKGTFMLQRFSYTPEIEVSGKTVYFIGDNALDGQTELWKTDGTRTGTVLVKKFTNGPWYHSSGLVDVYGTLYLGLGRGELWKSNGTAESTTMLKDFHDIKYIGKGGGRAIISVRTPEGTDELWRSSGTTRSTARLRPIKFTGGFATNDNRRTTVNDIFYFAADDGVHGIEMWRSDGTTTGTYMLKDLRPNDQLRTDSDFYTEYDFYAVAAFRDTVYFTGKTSDNTYAIFKSNGTRAGTTKVADVPFIDQLVAAENKLLMFAKHSYGTELWSTGGTAESTSFVMRLDSLKLSSVSHATLNGATYFSWRESENLWRSDGTECGTYVVQTPPNPFPIVANGNDLIFGAWTVKYEKEPHRLSTLSLPASPCAEEMMTTSNLDKVELKVADYSPNPFNEAVTVRINTTSDESAQIIVKRLTGEIVYRDSGLSPNTEYTLGKNWPKGLYVVEVMIKGRMESFRLIKK